MRPWSQNQRKQEVADAPSQRKKKTVCGRSGGVVLNCFVCKKHRLVGRRWHLTSPPAPNKVHQIMIFFIFYRLYVLPYGRYVLNFEDACTIYIRYKLFSSTFLNILKIYNLKKKTLSTVKTIKCTIYTFFPSILDKFYHSFIIYIKK